MDALNTRPPLSPQQQSPATNSAAFSISTGRLVLAFAVAAVSDLLSFLFTWFEPAVVVIDLGTAAILFVLLGRRWELLPGFVAEAVPGLSMFPTWFLVVAVVAVRNKN